MKRNRSLALAFAVTCVLFVPALVRAGDDQVNEPVKEKVVAEAAAPAASPTTRAALQDFLAKQTNDDIDGYAKKVKSVLKGWKKRAKKELGEQNSHTVTFNSAYSIIELAKDDNVKSKKIDRILSCLDKLDNFKSVAALRALLEANRKTAPKVKFLALKLLTEANQHFLSDVEHEAIKELIDAATKDSFKLAIERLEDGEHELFAKMAGE